MPDTQNAGPSTSVTAAAVSTAGSVYSMMAPTSPVMAPPSPGRRREPGSLGAVRAYDVIRMLSRDGRPTPLGDAITYYGGSRRLCTSCA
ncbi:putative IS21 family IS1474-like transposase [Streptomyces avermitilis MA-4680 = NBRC 14893]|uniref:IS21 family IS1474-like transposase n=1 Tax=Streptomyces avermitilis (strain ATCC 31267 / DSM 46492 / JCM 5070 / NBRC 14893 / NCIMB 12804 / NRRL 8165 / MA-4680) TaxID=227882 RepID=Q82QQ9_STRAW|nr:putative IS21 family IS1474-like transposase [Streptomyces avermitilis MA-4680 = NBRC 14893]